MLFKKVRGLDGAAREVVSFLVKQGVRKEEIRFTSLTGPHQKPPGRGHKGKYYAARALAPGRDEYLYTIFENGHVDEEPKLYVSYRTRR